MKFVPPVPIQCVLATVFSVWATPEPVAATPSMYARRVVPS